MGEGVGEGWTLNIPLYNLLGFRINEGDEDLMKEKTRPVEEKEKYLYEETFNLRKERRNSFYEE